MCGQFTSWWEVCPCTLCVGARVIVTNVGISQSPETNEAKEPQFSVDFVPTMQGENHQDGDCDE